MAETKGEQELSFQEEGKGDALDSANGTTAACEMDGPRQMLSPDAINALKIKIREMRPAELEEFVLKKIVETFNSDTMVVQLKSKCLHLDGERVKLREKLEILLRRVAAVSNALQVHEENEATTHPADRKPTVPLKYVRSVGIQVSAESFPKTHLARDFVPEMTDSNATVVMNEMSSSPYSNNLRTSPTSNTPQDSPSPNKRIRTTSSVAEPDVIDLTEDESDPISIQNDAQNSVVNQVILGQGTQPVASGYHLVIPEWNVHPAVFPQAGTSARAFHPPTQVRGQNRSRGRARRSQPNRGQAGRPLTLTQLEPRAGPSNTPTQIRGQNRGRGRGRSVRSNRGRGGRGKPFTVAQIEPQAGPSRPNFTLPQLPGPTIPNQQLVKFTKEPPPKPQIATRIGKDGGILLDWTHIVDETKYSDVVYYEIFACLEPLIPNAFDPPPAWIKLDDVEVLPLPMSCTIEQFSDTNLHHFIIRGIDVGNRSGSFSEVASIVVQKKV